MPIALLICYALPAIPLAALTLPLYIIVPTFYAETLGLSLAAVGTALLVIRVVDALTDPLIGWLSDRIRPRFGRRRGMFALSLPFAGLASIMLFWPPRDAFTLVGTLIAIALPFAIGLGNGDGLHGLAVLGLSVAAGLVLFGGLAVWRVPEPREYSTSRLSIATGLRHMAANRPFLRLISAFFLNGLANGIPATLFLYFVSQKLGATEMRGPLLFLYFLAGLAGVPLGVRLAGKFGKHRAWCWAMLVNCAIFALVPLLGTGDIAAFAAVCVATGICLGFDLALPSSIQADVIDVDTAASGEQRSGLYFAAWALATKLSLALGVGIVFPLLGMFGFDPAEGASNSEAAIAALTAIYVWIPIALKLAAIALMWRFPLDETAQASLRDAIEARA